MSNTYFDINKDVYVLIVSKLKSLDDISSMTDIIPLKNLDYMKLCSICHPELFPVKFLYGDTIERYNWSNLYFNFLNEDAYSANILTGRISKYMEININLEIFLFLVIIGKIPVVKITNYVIKKVFGIKDHSTKYYNLYNRITGCILPFVCNKLFTNDRYLYMEGAKEVISNFDSPDTKLDTIFVKFLKENAGIARHLSSVSVPIYYKLEKLLNYLDDIECDKHT